MLKLKLLYARSLILFVYFFRHYVSSYMYFEYLVKHVFFFIVVKEFYNFSNKIKFWNNKISNTFIFKCIIKACRMYDVELQFYFVALKTSMNQPSIHQEINNLNSLRISRFKYFDKKKKTASKNIPVIICWTKLYTYVFLKILDPYSFIMVLT